MTTEKKTNEDVAVVLAQGMPVVSWLPEIYSCNGQPLNRERQTVRDKE